LKKIVSYVGVELILLRNGAMTFPPGSELWDESSVVRASLVSPRRCKRPGHYGNLGIILTYLKINLDTNVKSRYNIISKLQKLTKGNA
jgi:hypothetical protein